MVGSIRPARRRSLNGNEGMWGMLFLLPTLVGFLMFTLVPVVMSLVYSFTEYDGVTAMKFIGLDNYAKLLGNREFRK